MGSKQHFLVQLFSRRISRRVAFWIFASIVVIEAIILVPSARRHEQKLIQDLEDDTSIKVTWIVAHQSTKSTDPDAFLTTTQAERILEELQMARQGGPMLSIQGAVIYDKSGGELAAFGDRPKPSISIAHTEKFCCNSAIFLRQ